MKILFFGSYDTARHPRVRVLMDGVVAEGADVLECNAPLDDSTAARVGLLFRPWLIPGFLFRLARTWRLLARRARGMPAPDVVIVGYMGHFDIHLARRLWPRTLLVLDHLIFLGNTAADRKAARSWVLLLLDWIDRRAVSSADLTVVDTQEHMDLLPEKEQVRAVVVPVGAPKAWFHPPGTSDEGPLRVVFFGLYTPLQGVDVIGDAIAALAGEEVDFLMIGKGQEYRECRIRSAANSRVSWVEWGEAADLPGMVAGQHICLGIFGTGPKAYRVVPNKVFQGAAAGCAVVTSDTPPQRRALKGTGLLVPPGDAKALAASIRQLAADRQALASLRQGCYRLAVDRFTPEKTVAPLRERLAATVRRARR